MTLDGGQGFHFYGLAHLASRKGIFGGVTAGGGKNASEVKWCLVVLCFIFLQQD